MKSLQYCQNNIRYFFSKNPKGCLVFASCIFLYEFHEKSRKKSKISMASQKCYIFLYDFHEKSRKKSKICMASQKSFIFLYSFHKKSRIEIQDKYCFKNILLRSKSKKLITESSAKQWWSGLRRRYIL